MTISNDNHFSCLLYRACYSSKRMNCSLTTRLGRVLQPLDYGEDMVGIDGIITTPQTAQSGIGLDGLPWEDDGNRREEEIQMKQVLLEKESCSKPRYE
ncbi:hypothetical protein SADUNF_Sadunf10G0120800 [Salix dunnii]|uniref:Uncharacterized protein n=1 Tax=Salix dunnii TaxID=1413687 RepID=A0A835MQW2_9ROSI|nr:hypothetical protein SADUNF_Sadunf10G0120800 [Salix dunnii]